MDHIDEA